MVHTSGGHSLGVNRKKTAVISYVLSPHALSDKHQIIITLQSYENDNKVL
jgi:hypothetical protein